MQNWVIFDGDNTLWDIEHHYDEARDQLCRFLQAMGFEYSEIDRWQRDRDIELQETFSYSPCRFPRSFEDTVINFVGEDKRCIKHCLEIAFSVFYKPPRFSAHIDSIIEYLSSKYVLGLITAGEKWVQEYKLEKFHLKHFFREIEVLPVKDKQSISGFLKAHGIDPESSWLVGDSLKSDIIPSVECGLNSIWYNNHNWELESLGADKNILNNSKVKTISDLSEIKDYL